MPTLPTFREERKLWRGGHQRVVGVDEVGRGPLAGPVVVAGVVFRKQPLSKMCHGTFLTTVLKEVRDSKKLTPKKREEIFETLKNNSEIEWRIARVSPRVIDRINIQRATELAILRVIKQFHPSLDAAIIDGSRFDTRTFAKHVKAIKLIVKADETVMSCALASIIAKVIRDRYMVSCKKIYPPYHFDRHKGYATEAHRKAIRAFGICAIHRKTFALTRQKEGALTNS